AGSARVFSCRSTKRFIPKKPASVRTILSVPIKSRFSPNLVIDLLKSKIHLLERKKKHHRRANKPLSMQEKSQIVLLHRQGLSNRQIAEQLNRSIATVWALVR
ncbi:TPA: helix-turn-helix domain-containing protein, partial [Haemophilus influenzae]